MTSKQDPHVVRRGHGNWSVLKEGTNVIRLPVLSRDQAKETANEIADREGTNPVYHDTSGKFSKK